MIYISTALYAEAKPIIERFNLKKSPASGRFQIFEGPQIRLVLMGTGPLSAAAATSFLLTKYDACEHDLFFNIGVCGAVEPGAGRRSPEGHVADIGEAYLCHRIIHYDSGKSYYPDILIRHPFHETSIETFSQPVSSKNASLKPRAELVDMEAAGCFAAASAFLPTHQLYFIKIVSDHLDGIGDLTAAFISKLVQDRLPQIESLLQAATEVQQTYASYRILAEDSSIILEKISENLRLTVTMQHQLKRWASQYKVRTGHDPDFLSQYLDCQVETKQEGKKIVEQIKRQLLHV